jgi:hypothetical protein
VRGSGASTGAAFSRNAAVSLDGDLYEPMKAGLDFF